LNALPLTPALSPLGERESLLAFASHLRRLSLVASREVQEQILHDVGAWQADGVVSDATAAIIRERCQVPGFGLSLVLRYLGIIGLVFLTSGILGLVAAASGSAVFSGFLLVSAGAGLTAAGLKLVRDKLGRYAWSARVVFVVAVLCAGGGLGLVLGGLGVPERSIPLILGVLLLPPVFVLAYRYSITFLLVLGLLGVFHWVGSWSQMFGRSTYELDIQDPKLMSVFALLVLGFGLWHERARPERLSRFYVAYQATALFYLNTSLLILSIDHAWGDRISQTLPYVLLLTAAALAQLVAGARLHNGRLLGFGITFTFINGFTRYSESFWDKMGKGAFFLVGGLLVFLAGAALELLLRRVQPISSQTAPLNREVGR